MMKILFCGYRKWALDLHANLDFHGLHKGFDLARSPKELELRTAKNKYDIIFFIGWSWIVKEEILNSSKCICMHPSPLPKYRGGSPLQHQILNGELKSAVTFFLMDDEIDHGPIIRQYKFSLVGTLEEIFERISVLCRAGIDFIIRNPIVEVEQKHSEATIYKRRTPEQSEIKPEDFKNTTATQIYNKVRALQDPYPLPYLLCKNNTKIYIKETEL